jgi:hypothetical protein
MRVRRISAVATAVWLAALTPAPAADPPSLEAIARRYLSAQQRAMEKTASAADVDAVLAFCTDSFRYVHPAFAAQVDGKEAARQGMLSHLGETADPVLAVERAMTAGRNVALDVATSFVGVESGKRVERRNLIVLTFEGDRISLRADF